MIRREDALEYHSSPVPGKLAVTPSKPCRTQRDLSLAYTPGVAAPCLEIARDPSLVYKYTAKSNLVAVVSNGTAVLGLGNIGPEAGKPVMEGKAVLFKRFADIDVFDIEINSENPRDIVSVCQLIEPTFGGINLEDIKAPECFAIEDTLRRTMRIPVFHDDQHGTAIISGAALLNALEIVGKRIDQVKIVFSGAGAAGLSCAAHYVLLGARRSNIVMTDVHGVIYRGRAEGMNAYVQRFAAETTDRTLAEAMEGADVFVGLSVGNVVTQAMLRNMAPNPIVFALANPDPEIPYEAAVEARPDAIVCTGRSDLPNQVNNVLGFPFIFRGALDVRASAINDEMMLAATYALAALAKEDVPDSVCRAYGVDRLEFGREYIIPKPFDPRVLIHEAAAVAGAAMKSGVAQQPVEIDQYKEQLQRRLSKANAIMRVVIHKAQRKPARVVFPEGDEAKILRAAQILCDEKIATPILLGSEETVRATAAGLHLHLSDAEIIDPAHHPQFGEYTEAYYRLRQRKGITRREAAKLALNHTVFGSLMLRAGDADALIGGLGKHYPATIRPALQILSVREGLHKVSGVYMLITPKGDVFFLADCTINIEPTSEDLAEIALCAAEAARRFDVEPRVAMLSFSNFGSTRHPLSDKVRRAVDILRKRAPDLMVDGEMQADTAVVPEILSDTYPFSRLRGGANVLIFPCLEAANIAYKLLAKVGGADVIGPILMGLSHPVHVLPTNADVNEIVNITAIAAVDAGEIPKRFAAKCAKNQRRPRRQKAPVAHV